MYALGTVVLPIHRRLTASWMLVTGTSRKASKRPPPSNQKSDPRLQRRTAATSLILRKRLSCPVLPQLLMNQAALLTSARSLERCCLRLASLCLSNLLTHGAECLSVECIRLLPGKWLTSVQSRGVNDNMREWCFICWALVVASPSARGCSSS